MKEKEFIFEGFIEISWADDFRTIMLVDGKKKIDLVKKFRAIFDLYECEVGVSYFLSNEKKTRSEMLAGYLSQLSGGIVAEYEENSYYYSEITNGTDYDTNLRIDGHNLFDEFGGDNKDKWCVLIVKIK